MRFQVQRASPSRMCEARRVGAGGCVLFPERARPNYDPLSGLIGLMRGRERVLVQTKRLDWPCVAAVCARLRAPCYTTATAALPR